MLKRNTCAQLGRETLEIINHGWYRTPSGRRVDIDQDMSRALASTRLYRPDDFPTKLDLSGPARFTPVTVEVTGETTLEAAQRLATLYPETSPCCLNFASAKHPGGGFLGGARAQEESLARSSGLYATLIQHNEFYEQHRALSHCLYSDHLIYSPGVPVFRTDHGDLLETPYRASFLTSAAVNAGAVRKNTPKLIPFIEPTMRQRLGKVLWTAATRGEEVLVLGAWGCGVFRNDPQMVADHSRRWLEPGGHFHGRFRHIVFAVWDPATGQPTLQAFQDQLG